MEQINEYSMWLSLTIASGLSSELSQCINTTECVQFETQHANTQLDEKNKRKKQAFLKNLFPC